MRPPRACTTAAVLVIVVVLSAFAPTGADKVPPEGAPPPPPDWKRVWADEFDGDALDRTKWAFDVGTGRGGWGNRELQSYTDRTDNAFVRDGQLHIRAARESRDGADFTSARLKTKGLFSKKYGRFEIRAKLPTGKGVWPAIWMLPETNAYGPWPASGEIDILEARGQGPHTVLGTIHFGVPHAQAGKDYTLPDGGTIADFHVYSLEWEPAEIRWLVDGKVYETQTEWWSASRRRRRGDASTPRGDASRPADKPDRNPWPAPFDEPFHLLLNVAVGGNFVGSPDADTSFPAEMVVDYVRVYDRRSGDDGTTPKRR
jgi:beta-glucanase (GH16 family)